MKNKLKPIFLVAQKNRALLVVAVISLGILVLQHREYFSPELKGAAVAATKEKIQISDFSPDGKRLYLDYCDSLNNCQIGWVDLSSNKVSLFEMKNTKDLVSSPSSSADSRQLAIIIKEAINNYETSQIGLLDLETNTYRPVTHSSTFKEWPAFSIDGKKIIYAQANRVRESGKTRFSGWDVYETDLETGIERRLTEFCFFLIDRTRYLNDNKRFVFSGESPGCNFPRPNTAHHDERYDYRDYKITQEGKEIYKKLYAANTVFMMTGNEIGLKPVVMNGEQSGGSVVSGDGKKIFFISLTNKIDNSNDFNYHYDVFVIEDGVVRRLTNLNALITGLAVSFHGDQVAYQSDPQRNHNSAIWIMDTVTKTHQKINLGRRSNFFVINIANQLGGNRNDN